MSGQSRTLLIREPANRAVAIASRRQFLKRLGGVAEATFTQGAVEGISQRRRGPLRCGQRRESFGSGISALGGGSGLSLEFIGNCVHLRGGPIAGLSELRRVGGLPQLFAQPLEGGESFGDDGIGAGAARVGSVANARVVRRPAVGNQVSLVEIVQYLIDGLLRLRCEIPRLFGDRKTRERCGVELSFTLWSDPGDQREQPRSRRARSEMRQGPNWKGRTDLHAAQATRRLGLDQRRELGVGLAGRWSWPAERFQRADPVVEIQRPINGNRRIEPARSLSQRLRDAQQ